MDAVINKPESAKKVLRKNPKFWDANESLSFLFFSIAFALYPKQLARSCLSCLPSRADCFLPDGKRSMTGWLSTCSVALPPLRVNRTTWYLPSLTVTALSSMMMSSVPTLKITPIFPRSYETTKKNLEKPETIASKFWNF